MACHHQDFPEIFLLVENPRKSNNLGSILRCASAFGIVTVIVVGFSKCAIDGSHGASKHVKIIGFPTGDQAIDFIRKLCKCSTIVGMMGSVPDGYDRNGRAVHEDELSGRANFCDGQEAWGRRSFPADVFPFSKGNLCVAVSKDRQGLPLTLSRLCDSFVHVPHMTLCTSDGPLLDTPSSLSILLYTYTNWAGFNERKFQGHKFDLAQPTRSNSADSIKQNNRAAARAARLENDEAMASLVSEGTMGIFFGAASVGDY